MDPKLTIRLSTELLYREDRNRVVGMCIEKFDELGLNNPSSFNYKFYDNSITFNFVEPNNSIVKFFIDLSCKIKHLSVDIIYPGIVYDRKV